MPDDVKLLPESGYKEYTFTMKKDKNIDPGQPNQWKPEPKYQQRLHPPSNAPGAWTNLSNTLEQCISSQAHVVGVAFTYHDYVTHNSYYKKSKSSRRKKIFLGWNEACELHFGRPTEWETQREFGPEHPYFGIPSPECIPSQVKTHAQIREEKKADAMEAERAADSDESSSRSSSSGASGVRGARKGAKALVSGPSAVGA